MQKLDDDRETLGVSVTCLLLTFRDPVAEVRGGAEQLSVSAIFQSPGSDLPSPRRAGAARVSSFVLGLASNGLQITPIRETGWGQLF